MTTRIPNAQTTNTGKSLAQAVNHFLNSLAEMRRIKALLDSTTSGSDWASLAADLGGGATSQNAQDAWTIMSTALTTIDVPATAELSRLDQG